MDLPSFSEVTWWIQTRSYEINNPRTDGFMGFELKKELYQLQQLLTESIERLPTYHGEDEWLKEQQTSRAFDKLSR